MATIHQMLRLMIDKEASDLHLTTQSPPQIRIHGHLVQLKVPALTAKDTKELCYSILTDAQKHKFEEERELDFSFGMKGLSRFRGNLFLQKGNVAGVFRKIPYEIPDLNDLGAPPILKELVKKTKGLILVTGPTGSGKSTTLAAMVDIINRQRNEHIITIEDPIEYLHPHKNCIVNQREVNSDTEDFKTALRYILRQDPDCVLIGELRDLETVSAALKIAETGHLTFATLHTNSCVQTINRVIDVFPAHQQNQIRSQLSLVLEGVMSQTLVPKANGDGRCLAAEVMIPNPAIRNLIREDKVHQLYSQMQIGQSKFGMQTMNQALYDLYARRLVSMDDVLYRSQDPEELRHMIDNGGSLPQHVMGNYGSKGGK
ncbi:MAG: type IV pilus twitching motility protein PilT [Deltaproteobacteria bacterium]|nr:type IV pilus twitching motility protein PilT [Deltaproteobacteria bacterium]